MRHNNLQDLQLSGNGILLYTDLWEKTAHQIVKLYFTRYLTRRTALTHKEKLVEDLIEIDVMKCSKLELSVFFKKCADFVVKDRADEEEHMQFRCVLADGEETPIKWFWIKTDHQKATLGHDIAFDTTILTKWYPGGTDLDIHLGHFRRKRWERCKQLQQKQARQAYKTIANFVR